MPVRLWRQGAGVGVGWGVDSRTAFPLVYIKFPLLRPAHQFGTEISIMKFVSLYFYTFGNCGRITLY